MLIFVEAGGVKIVTEILQLYINNIELVQLACGVLYAGMQHKRTNIFMICQMRYASPAIGTGRPNKFFLGDKIRVNYQYLKHADCCIIPLILFFSVGERIDIYPCDIIIAALSLLNIHTDNEKIMQDSIRLLWSMTFVLLRCAS